jgi:hypothetical protein
MTTRTRAAALAAALAVVLGVAGCTDDAAIEPKADAAKVVVQPKVAKPPARLTTATFAPVTTAAYSKVKSWSGVMRISAGGQTVTATITQTYRPTATRVDLSSPQLGGAAHGILIGGVLYLHLPIAELHGKYLKIDPRRSKDPAAVLFAQLMEGSDSSKSMKAIGKAVVKVKYAGHDTIGFRRVEKYDVTMNNAAMFRAMGMKLPAGAPRTSVQSIWLGGDRLTYKTVSGGTQVTVTGYNSVAPITAPSARMIVKPR